MKFNKIKILAILINITILIINFSLIFGNISQKKSEIKLENLNSFEKFQAENNVKSQLLLNKCLTGTITDKSLCENLNRLNKASTRTMYRVQAITMDLNSTNTKDFGKSEIFNLNPSINTCKNEDCEFCCLSNNRCGTKKQCVNSKYYRKIFYGIFLILTGLLSLVFIIKCFQVDSFPDQDKNDKLKAEELSSLISLYAITRNNRSKFIK